MPRTLHLSPRLQSLLAAQDGVVHRRQCVADGFTADAVQRRVERGEWQRLLPGVLLTHGGDPTRRQRLVAARLWAGPQAAVDGASACRWHGIPVDGFDERLVHLVVPLGAPARTRDFVVVRRTTAPIRVAEAGLLPYVDAATAAIVAARSSARTGPAVALLSRALQLGKVSVGELRDARDVIGHKWCGGVDRALVAVGVGVRSPAEKQMRDLVLTSRVLPEPRWNQWLDLGDGGTPVCVDALFDAAALVNEVEGRRYHAWAEQFENMHARHERLTAAGLVVLHATPQRLRREPEVVLRNLERVYRRHVGDGLPPNVRLVDPARLRAA